MKKELIMTDPTTIQGKAMEDIFVKTKELLSTKKIKEYAIPEDKTYTSINFYYLIDNVPAVKIKLEQEDPEKTCIFFETVTCYRNQGHTNEAFAIAINYIFNNLAVPEIYALPINETSAHILEKHGFYFTARSEEAVLLNPAYHRKRTKNFN